MKGRVTLPLRHAPTRAAILSVALQNAALIFGLDAFSTRQAIERGC